MEHGKGKSSRYGGAPRGMKALAKLRVDDYGMDDQEQFVARLTKIYLGSMPEDEVVNLLSGIIQPQEGIAADVAKKGVILPVAIDQNRPLTIVHGHQLAALFDTVIGAFRESYREEMRLAGVSSVENDADNDAVNDANRIMAVLDEMDGAVQAQNTTVDMLLFLEDCYRALCQ